MAPSPLLRTLAVDSLLVLTVKVLSLPLGYYSLILLARLYGAEAMGTYTVGLYLLTTLAVICRLGLDTGILRFCAAGGPETGRDRLLALLFPALALVGGLGALTAGGLWLAGDWLAGRFQAPQLLPLLPWVCVLLPLTAALGVLAEALRALQGPRWVVLSQDGVFPLLFLLFICALAGAPGARAVAVLGLALLLSHLASGSLIVARLLQGLRQRPAGAGPPEPLRELLRYSTPLFLSGLVWLAFGSLDSLLLGWFQPPAQVAYFEAANKTALLVGLPLIAINAVLPPLFSRLHGQGERRQLEGLGRAASRWTYYLALPLTLGCLLLAPRLLGWFGPGFEAGATALRLLALAQLVNVACGSVGFLLAMTGHQVALTRILALAALAGLPLLGVGASLGGLTGLAAAKAAWLVGVNLGMSVAVHRRLGLTIFARDVLPAHLGGAVAAGIFGLSLNPLGPVAAALLFGCTYLGLTARPVLQEMMLLLQRPVQEGTS
jgi:O-antigen/teichoic acid export membrane protein